MDLDATRPHLASTLMTRDHIVVCDEGTSLGVALLSDVVDRWVQVHMVMPNGPFHAAGIRANDVILKINGKSVLGHLHQDIVAILKAAGTQITVTVASLKDVTDARLPSESPEDELENIADSKLFNITRIPGVGLGIALCSEKDSSGMCF